MAKYVIEIEEPKSCYSCSLAKRTNNCWLYCALKPTINIWDEAIVNKDCPLKKAEERVIKN